MEVFVEDFGFNVYYIVVCDYMDWTWWSTKSYLVYSPSVRLYFESQVQADTKIHKENN